MVNDDEDNNQELNKADEDNINTENTAQNNKNIDNSTSTNTNINSDINNNQENKKAKKPDIGLYIEIAFIIAGIILLAVGSLQVKSIAHAKWNGFTDVFFPLGIIFIVSPGLLHFKKLRTKNFAISIIIVLLIGILIIYILLFPYKMFTVHFGLLGDVIAEYVIGLFFIVFFVSHLTKKHLLKEKELTTRS